MREGHPTPRLVGVSRLKGIETVSTVAHGATGFSGLVGVSRLKGIETEPHFAVRFGVPRLVGVSRLKGIETNESPATDGT